MSLELPSSGEPADRDFIVRVLIALKPDFVPFGVLSLILGTSFTKTNRMGKKDDMRLPLLARLCLQKLSCDLEFM